MKNKIAKWLVATLEKVGIDPIYFCTVVSILICFMYLKEFKNWKKTRFSVKLLAISTLFGTIVLILISLFKILGILTL
jgi:hypothetical protein